MRSRRPRNRPSAPAETSLRSRRSGQAPGRPRAVIRAGGQQQLLGDVRGERRQRPRQQDQRLDLGLGVGAAELSAALDHALLEVLDPLEEPGHVAHRLVHLQLLEVGGDPG